MDPHAPHTPDTAEDRALLVVAANSEVIAFRRTDGTIAWRQTFSGSFLGMQTRDMGAMELAFLGGRVYIGARDRIVCLDYTTGAVVGQVPLPGPVRRPCFLLEGDHLYVVGSDRLLCFTHGGEFVWQSPHGLSLLDSPAIGVPGNVRPGDDVGSRHG
jgi:outer membrane protein assembly factor BamB